MTLLLNIAQLLLSYLFLNAAFSKIQNPAYFRQSIADYQLLPVPLLKTGGYTLIGLELLAGVFALIPTTAIFSVLIMAALLGTYALAIAVNLVRGRRYLDCGCNGPNNRQAITWFLVLRNLALLMLVMILLLLKAQLPTELTAWVVALLASCFGIALYHTIIQLRVNHQQIKAGQQPSQQGHHYE